MLHSSPNGLDAVRAQALEPDVRFRWVTTEEVEQEGQAFAQFFMDAALNTFGLFHPRDILARTFDCTLMMCAIYDVNAAVIEGVLWFQRLKTPGGEIADAAFVSIQQGKVCTEPLWRGVWRGICESLAELGCERVQIAGPSHLGVLLGLQPIAHQYATMLRKREG